LSGPTTAFLILIADPAPTHPRSLPVKEISRPLGRVLGGSHDGQGDFGGDGPISQNLVAFVGVVEGMPPAAFRCGPIGLVIAVGEASQQPLPQLHYKTIVRRCGYQYWFGHNTQTLRANVRC